MQCTPRWSTSRAALVVAGTAVVLAAGAGTAWAATSVHGTPSTNLKDGSNIAISGTGWGPNTSLFIVQCSATTPESCDTARLASTTSDATGSISATFTVHSGAIGNGTCAAGSKNCIVAVTDLAKQYVGFFPLSFAAAGTPTPTKSPTPKPTVSKPSSGKTSTGQTGGGGTLSSSGSGTNGSTTPTSVAAGSGGAAGRQGPDGALAIGLAVAGAALATGTVRQLRRRPAQV